MKCCICCEVLRGLAGDCRCTNYGLSSTPEPEVPAQCRPGCACRDEDERSTGQLLDALIEKCRVSDCDFTIRNGWHDGSGGVTMTFEWSITGGGSRAYYFSIEECLKGCLLWLEENK